MSINGPRREDSMEEFENWYHDPVLSRTWLDPAFRSSALNFTSIVLFEQNPTFMLSLTKVIWPDLVETERGVFRAEAYNRQSVEAWWAQYPGQRGRVESVVNHLHVDELFQANRKDGAEDPADPDGHEYFAKLLAKLWHYRLAECFPGRRFQVPAEEGTFGWEVTFFQEE